MRCRWWAVLTALVACHSPDSSRGSSASPASASPPPVPAPPGPPEIARPSEVACDLGQTSFARLRLRAGGPVFARVEKGPARIVLPAGGAARGAYVEAEGDGVVVRGTMATEDIRLHPATPFSLAGVLMLRPFARLRWAGGSAGKIEVGYVPFPDIQPPHEIVSLPPEAEAVDCVKVSLDVRELSAGPPSSPRRMWLRRDRDVSVARAPDAAPSVALRYQESRDGAADPGVVVLEEQGDKRRILQERSDVFVSGWVTGEDLVRDRPRPGFGMIGLLNDREKDAMEPAPPGLAIVCAADLPLIAEQAGERARVGAIRAGTAIVRGAADGELTRITPARVPWLGLVKGAAMLVPSAAIAGCPAAGDGGS